MHQLLNVKLPNKKDSRKLELSNIEEQTKNSSRSKNGANTIENILNQVTKANGTDGIVNRPETIKSSNSSTVRASSPAVNKEKNSKITKLKNFLNTITTTFNSSLYSSANEDTNRSLPKTVSTNNDLDEFNPLSTEEKEDSIHEITDKNTNTTNNNNNNIDSSRLRVDNSNLKEVRYRDRSLNSSIRSATSSASKLTVNFLFKFY